MSKPLETYALIGDRRSAALVGMDGSIDWLCLPRFDSHACFAALLGDESNGRWLLAPDGDATCTRRYLDDTLVLESTYTTASGKARVIDFMPTGEQRADVVRAVEVLEGEMTFVHELVICFNYGATVPWVTRVTENWSGHELDALRCVAGADSVTLRGPRMPTSEWPRHRDRFTLSEGDRIAFDLVWGPSHRPVPPPIDEVERLEATIAESRSWIGDLAYRGPYEDQVRRSVLVLRALTHVDTGGIVAAVTTSLPETLGGSRNWDYRFSWLRDAALTVEALVHAGFADGTAAWRNWLIRAAAGDVKQLLIMYEVDGGRDLAERELDHLPGYEGSQPVRIGNGAHTQRQTDVLGEVMIALELLRNEGIYGDRDTWQLQRLLLDGLAETWAEPDNGIWEVRGPRRSFTHSKAMVWAAFDRGIRAATTYDLPGDVARWAEVRDAAREDVLTRGHHEERGHFTQHDETTEVDASLLLLATIGIVDADDPRFVRTVEQIENDLLRDGLVLRYRTESGVDGLSGDEHPFLICCFWLVIAYAQIGRRDDAVDLMERLLGTTNDVGLMAEQYSPELQRQIGNLPQAFSHIGLIMAASALAGHGPGDDGSA
ncbi:glucoamylase [Pseudoclavibacter endophyticus]|uniref:Glycoside hydrolase family 15 protein n=1 Tax=Pseudoclavibacter endophyticus TaxID=1778590 RepID=A0A6H9WAK5_9MICO|nr:glycoside hydrolase family 15 protein [Pseudoclavibacter endophyticus]KAB1646754.1 glycoside hydrolase family 15 protein [Pseudoclavibacter endophyticus]GGA75852.1 glucoamylase [Pseudoclavibacter endophyticus]